jgi:NUMOD4 motif-containing protein/HNH endonuclease
MTEIWKSIAGFDGYEVSNLGQVRSIDRIVATKNGQLRRYSGKILGQATDDRGYRHVCLWKENHQVGFVVHRLVADAFLRRIEQGEEVNHDNFDKQNNTTENLEVTTSHDNMSHATKAGRFAKKLTEENVREIKFSTLWGEDKYSLALRFGVDRVTINHVNSGHSWKRVDLPEWQARHD